MLMIELLVACAFTILSSIYSFCIQAIIQAAVQNWVHKYVLFCHHISLKRFRDVCGRYSAPGVLP